MHLLEKQNNYIKICFEFMLQTRQNICQWVQNNILDSKRKQDNVSDHTDRCL